jgi:hypothetical protein
MMRLAFVDCYDWEQKENMFLLEYKKLKNSPIPNGETSSVEILLETLPIHVRKETIVAKHHVIEKKEDKDKKFRKKIFPQSTKI